MNGEQARAAIAALIRPMAYADLTAAIHRATPLVAAAGTAPRTDWLGPDPAALLLGSYGRLGEPLTYHSARPSAPPPTDSPDSDAAFRRWVSTLHERGYSIRFPALRPLSPPLDRAARALETILHQPVSVSAFWNHGPLTAPVHFDRRDNIAIQLRGTKTWRIARGPSMLSTTWDGIPGPPPTLGDDPLTATVRPGDVLYVPRGLPHTVDADGESIHVVLGFVPLTLRDAAVALLDEMTEQDRALRETVLHDLDEAHVRGGLGTPHALLGRAIAAMQQAGGTPGFLEQALRRRSARAIGSLAASATEPSLPAAIGLDTPLRRAAQAFGHLSANADTIDFAYPGGHLYLHRGAARSIAFIAATDAFRPRDMPDDLDPEVRLALVRRFLDVGFLEIAGDQ